MSSDLLSLVATIAQEVEDSGKAGYIIAERSGGFHPLLCNN